MRPSFVHLACALLLIFGVAVAPACGSSDSDSGNSDNGGENASTNDEITRL